MIKVVKKQDFPATVLQKAVVMKDVAGGDLIVNVGNFVKNLEKGQALQVCRHISAIRGFNAFYMGGVLLRIQEEGWWGDKGFNSFKEFVEQGLGMARSTAYDYIGIYVNLIESSISWNEIKHLGWTKIRLFAKHLTPENVKEWTKAAEDLNAGELREYVKNQVAITKSSVKLIPYLSTHADTDHAHHEGEAPTHVDTGEAPNAGGTGESSLATEKKPNLVTKESAEKITTTKSFKLYPDQEETVNLALEICKKESNTEYDSVAIEYICMDFLASRTGKEKAAHG